MKKFYCLVFLVAYTFLNSSCQGRTNSDKGETNINPKDSKEIAATAETEIRDLTSTEQQNSIANAETELLNRESEDEQKLKTVLTSTNNQINLHDYGALGTGKDETKEIQEALKAAVGKILYIPKQRGQYYMAGQLMVPSNVQIVCDPNVIFVAKDFLKQDFKDFEVLFRFEDVENITFDGGGALFKMNKEKYSNEFNHLFMVNGSKNVVLKNIRAEDSGGDGFYVGAIRTKNKFPANITIEDCTATNNRRQGLSVTSADGLLVKKSAFNASKGADPETGVDIEPGVASAVLKNIKLIDCKAEGNRKRGFLVHLNRLNATSAPVDIIFENCIAEGNMEGFSTRQTRGVQGKVEYVNCIARNSRVTGFTESSSLANSVKKVYRNCVAENSNTANRKMDGYKFKANYYLAGNAKRREVIGNSEFINCKSIVNERVKTVDYGMVIDNGETEVENIILNNFKAQGTHLRDKLHIPQKQMRALSIK